MERNCMMSFDELRQMAAHFRLIAVGGENLRFVAALHQLADEYDAEAAEVAGEQNTAKKNLF
jgi:hypothetical protein